MYAVIRTGGKQYRVQPGDVLQVEKLDKALGSEFAISDILAIGGELSVLGTPVVKNATVTVVVTKQSHAKKVIVFKKNRRHGYRKFKGHKQEFTELFIKAITTPDGKTTKSDQEPKVLDMAKVREDRILQKVADRKERASNRSTPASEEVVTKSAKKAPAAKKKVAKKAAGKKVAKKAAPKKKTAKKTTKK